MNIVLDAGALIALERSDRAMWTVLKNAVRNHDAMLVPTTVLAQVWRGTAPQARMATALQHCIPASFDDLAKPVGALCGRAKTADICDAHVALVAVAHGDVLYTADVEDLERLIAACRGRRPVIVKC